jgi:hypothetical protein
MPSSDRLLFVLKKREGYWGSYSMSSGLLNSCSFVVQMLKRHGIRADLIEVNDNNDIDREVRAHRPTHVVIEAFWVVPEKFDVLRKLHPMVHWIVRNHSETPFLANEGIAFEWCAGYLRRCVEIMCNSPRAVADIRQAARAWGLNDRLVTHGPNYYPVERLCEQDDWRERDGIDVGCFGAIRPLKNHLGQAIAATTFGRGIGERVRFHVNATRLEGNGDPVLKNLRAYFADCVDAELVEHPWLPHAAFVDLIAGMDVVTQVSFSETFNIVAADAVCRGIPVVVSSEVPWIGAYAHARPTEPASIVDVFERIWGGARVPLISRQWRDLSEYDRQSEREWVGRFGVAGGSAA